MSINMKYGPDGYHLTERGEGVRLTPYQDQGGVWTVGVGHTGDDFDHDQPITEAQCDAFLAADIQAAVDGVNAAIDVVLSQHEFEACVDLAFNIGVHAFTNSTVCRKLNAGDYAGGKLAMAMWDKVHGERNTGLDNRRQAEMFHFDQPDVA